MSLIASYKPYKLTNVIVASQAKKFTVVSTFAGGGGSSTGYKLAGGHVLFANEFVPAAVKTYLANDPDTPVLDDDIRKLARDPSLLKSFGIKQFELDIFDGSPPCATHSPAAGRSKDYARLKSQVVKYSDVEQKNIEGLIFDYVEMAIMFQPKVCVIENVPGITKADEFGKAMERLRRVGDSSRGYLIVHKELNAADFGVPQSRNRLFVICVRSDVAKAIGLDSEEKLQDIFPLPTSKRLTLLQALKGLKVDITEATRLKKRMLTAAAYPLIRALPHNPPKNTTINDIDPSWTSDFSWVRCSWDKPCPTITQAGAQAVSRGGPIHPSEDRVFTLGELKRIFGMPDDFKLPGLRFEQKAERLGRMVAPLVMKELSASIYEKVLKPIGAKKTMAIR